MKNKNKLMPISLGILLILIIIGGIHINNIRKIAIMAEIIVLEKQEADRLASINPLENIKVSYSVYDIDDTDITAKPSPFKNILNFNRDMDIDNGYMIQEDSILIGSTRPGSELTLSFENNGDIIPKNPSIIFNFDMIVLNSLSEYLQYYDAGMEASNHVHGMGYYSTFKWYLGENNILYKDQPLTMFNLPFSGSEVEVGEPGELTVTLVDSEGNKLDYIFIIEVNDID